MMKRTLLFALLCAALAAPAWAHGGSYRGPNGGIPPGGREPSDPEPPPPPPSDPGTPGNPTTPKDPQPGTTPPDTGHDTPNSPPPPNVPVPSQPEGRTRSKTRQLTFDSWRYWWAYNNAEILAIKTHVLHAKTISSDPRYYVQGFDKTNRIDVSRPTRVAIQRRIIPALVRTIERPGEHDDIIGGAAIALAKAGHAAFIPQYAAMIDGAFISSKGRKVSFGSQTTESAVLSLGLLPDLDAGQKAAVRQICLHALGNDKLRRRDRAWAAASLGFQRDGDAVQPMLAMLKDRWADDNIPCGILAGIGLMGKAGAPALPELESALVKGRLMGRNVRNNDRIRAFAAFAIAKIGDPSRLPLMRSLLRSRAVGRIVKRSVAIAAGVLAADADAENKKETVDALLYYMRHAKGDVSGTNFALIALSRIGTPRAIRRLLDEAEDGRYSHRPMAALGLATFVWTCERDAKAGHKEPLDKDLRQKIVTKLARLSKRFKDSDTRSAFMLARGIVRDASAIDELVKIASKRSTNPALRGYCCEALGLIGKPRQDVKDALKIALKDRTSSDLRRSAATGLGLLHDAQVLDILVKELKKAKSFAVQGQLIQAIGTIGDQRAVTPLIEMMEDKGVSTQTRAMAAVGLGMIADLLEVPRLSRLSKDYNYRASVKDIDELLFIL